VLLGPDQVRPPRRPLRQVRQGDAALSPMLLLATASGFGAMVASSMSAFLVTATVADGLGEGPAGLLLALGSLLAIGTRLAIGRFADQRGGRPLLIASSMAQLGAVGLLILAAGTSPLIVVVGAALAFGPGWGWNGLLVLAVVRTNRNAPAAATGIVLAGGTAGAVVGPLVFAWMLSHAGVAAGWIAMAAAATVSAGLLLAARAVLRRDVGRRELAARDAAALERA
jgi:MFS family permease